MAGGRFRGRNAEAAGAEIKALTLVGGMTLLARALSALRDVPAVARIVVVGPEAVKASLPEQIEWIPETSTLLGNVRAGAAAAYPDASGDTVLLIGSDLAAPQASSLTDFIDRSPERLGVTVPLVERSSVESAFPGCPGAYVPLREGQFTIGSQFLAPVSLLLNPTPGMAAMLGHRKSQLLMARTLGWPIAWGLLRRTLTIEQLEQRASIILGAPAGAVRDCAPDLAFDIDDERDLVFARAWHEKSGRSFGATGRSPAGFG